jgi:D-glycero-alpha-D-manno-heptose-7-phosphate kinase
MATHNATALACEASAPTRVDLAGGTLDIWPLAPILQEKFDLWNAPVQTVNVAIDLRASARLDLVPSPGIALAWSFEDRTRPSREEGMSLSGDVATDYPLHRAVVRHYQRRLLEAGFARVHLSTDALAPKGSGLGGSSSVVVAILAAFQTLLERKDPRTTALCEVAKNLEAGLLGGLAGNQDHFGAAFGGVQAVQHSAEGSSTRRLACDGRALLSHVVLAHSGQQHFSAFNNWLILERVLTGHAGTLGKLASIARIAHEVVEPLEAGDFARVAKLVSKEWEYRRVLAEGVTTPILDTLHAAALKAGAAGGKVCGAGGGGVLVMFVDDPGARGRVERAIVEAGGTLLPAGYAETGVTVTLGSDATGRTP